MYVVRSAHNAITALTLRTPDSGDFIVINEDLGMMFVAVTDERHHHPPAGWQLTEIMEFPDGSTEAFFYRRQHGRL